MNRPTNNTTILLFASLLPLALVFTLFALNSGLGSGEPEQEYSVQWTIHIDDAELNTGTLGTLTQDLHREIRGERRAGELNILISRITIELISTDHATPQFLTDLLRDLSLEHPDNKVRLDAYEAMIMALETEQTPFSDNDIAAN